MLNNGVADGQVTHDAETSGPIGSTHVSEQERPRYGLTGMRERAAALGGEVTAGPTPTGWRVRCRLPLDGTPTPLGDEAGNG